MDNITHHQDQPAIERLNLTGQVVFITGAGAGIGRAIALAFAGAGAHIVIADREPARCEEVALQVRELGAKALPITVDVTHTDQISEAVNKAIECFQRLDILVNNAGGVSLKPFLTQSERSWRKHVDLNLISAFAATAAVVPEIIKGSRGGSIINVTSIEASRAAPNAAVYSACKAGLENFTRTMALELADHKIRVNALAPDYTVTPGVRGNIRGPVDQSQWIEPSPAREEATARRIPAARTGYDYECADAALFLASPLSSYVNGTILRVDGGTWASSGWARNKAGQWTLTPEI
ncbi:SDR family NAD(P)-dependent oxidoreductase [Halioxenophilus aromaticivorans]|uniref:SDR family oxidoreductase n=1 Tax=Halioxenophilus aromaticivorans TaxID=1306992 RepID=A0AAV3U3Z3_9ALTE